MGCSIARRRAISSAFRTVPGLILRGSRGLISRGGRLSRFSLGGLSALLLCLRLFFRLGLLFSLRLLSLGLLFGLWLLGLFLCTGIR